MTGCNNNTASENNKTTSKKSSIIVVNLTSPVKKGENVLLKIRGEPMTDYNITVYYDSGKSTEKGLETKESDSGGKVTWQWKVSENVAPGSHKIVISGGGDKVTAYLETE